MESVEESLAYLAGFGIYFYIIAQDMQQLIKTYGENQTITANTHIQIGFAPNNPKSIKYLSEMTGVTTVVKPQVTTSGSRIGVFQKQVSTTYQEVRRQLMTEDEVMRMPKAKMDGRQHDRGWGHAHLSGGYARHLWKADALLPRSHLEGSYRRGTPGRYRPDH